MEKPGSKIEFLCLSCGLQGLCSVHTESMGELSEILCQRCGDHVVTTYLRIEKASLVTTV